MKDYILLVQVVMNLHTIMKNQSIKYIFILSKSMSNLLQIRIIKILLKTKAIKNLSTG